MKTYLTAAFAFTTGLLFSDSLKFSGILGNSGEQGKTLIRFSEKPASGIGVVYDSTGSLWDRAGEKKLNRYAPDGRLLATYPLPTGGSANARDVITLIGETLLLKLDKRLFTLPVSAPSGTSPKPLDIEATRLSFNHETGWAAAANGKEIFKVKTTGETEPVATLNEEPYEIEIGPGGKIFMQAKDKLGPVEAASADEFFTSPGDRPQWLAGHWFGSAGHGTIRRFDKNLKPDPGVVLGGASGWFIGYVEGNHEMNSSRGLAKLEGNLFASSGLEGVMHLLEWKPLEKRFQIIRRIGAIPVCTGLAIDSKGRVWFQSGVWNWTDGPDAAITHSVPPADNGIMGATMTKDDVMIAPGVRWKRSSFFAGNFDGPVKPFEVEGLPENAVACALISTEKREAILITDSTGKGSISFHNPDGKPAGKASDTQLLTSSPIHSLTSLGSTSEKLYAAADGHMIEFSVDGNHWKETRRWNSWDADRFGEKIHLTVSENRLWVSDTDRHRVLCFDLSSGKPVGNFGISDEPGDDLGHLNFPKTLAANGRRAVIFDSSNQRLIKLELTP